MRYKWQTSEEKKVALKKKKEYMRAYMKLYNQRPRNANLIGYVYGIDGKLMEGYENFRANLRQK